MRLFRQPWHSDLPLLAILSAFTGFRQNLIANMSLPNRHSPEITRCTELDVYVKNVSHAPLLTMHPAADGDPDTKLAVP